MHLQKASVAALNNAEWCAAIWTSHGLQVERAHGLWFCSDVVPQYYPNVVTVDAAADATQQIAFIGELKRSTNIAAMSVKDSFSRLDLRALEMSILFEAQWLQRQRSSITRAETVTLSWDIIEDENSLANWERAWRRDDPNPTRIFPPVLLENRQAIVLAGRNGDGVIEAGGIAFDGAGLLGITNVFGDRKEFFTAIVRLRPDASLVCYESGSDLNYALEDGFEVLGRLRIWRSV